MKVYAKNIGNTVFFLVVCTLIATIAAVSHQAMEIRNDPANKPTAEANLRNWARSMSLEVQGGTCVYSDSDGDGYVSCTAAKVGGELIDLECSYDRGGGCKLAEKKVIEMEQGY